MRFSLITRVGLAAMSLVSLLVLAGAGCSRTKYRLQADRDAYCVIAERNGDPRWHRVRLELAGKVPWQLNPSIEIYCPGQPGCLRKYKFD